MTEQQILETITELLYARSNVADARSASEMDPSWIRPRMLSRDECDRRLGIALDTLTTTIDRLRTLAKETI